MSDTNADDSSTTAPTLQADTKVFPVAGADPGSPRSAADDTREIPAWFPRIDGYDILEILGRGGMGVVYRAWQHGLKRAVALKMILSGELAGAEEVARFLTEAEAVARVKHPNIVQVYEIGEHRAAASGTPLPFISLEFVGGGSLADRLDGTPRPPKAAAAFIEKLARAAHFAHDAGVVHRDLKPANILLAEPGPGAVPDPLAFEPKIADFGLAKLTDATETLTATGKLLGTLTYMAPEQAAGGRYVDHRADVYALGSILYELLTGHAPFRGTTPHDTVTLVVSQDPVPPRRLQPQVPRDLDTICLKCLEKDPLRRYQTAGELADELKDFVAGRPIKSRPVRPLGHALRWCGRNPWLAALIAGIWVSLLAGIGCSTYFMVRAWHEADRALAERERSEHRLYVAEFGRAYLKWKDGQIGEVRQILDSLVPGDGREDLRGFEWHYLRRLCELDLRTLHAHEPGTYAVTYSPDGQYLASAGADGTVRVWDRLNGATGYVLPAQTQTVIGLAYSPDGRRLAWAGTDGVVIVWTRPKDGVQPAHNSITHFVGHVGQVRGVAFSPDGHTLATAGRDKTVRLWDVATGAEKARREHAACANAVSFAPGGTHLASAGDDGMIALWHPITAGPVDKFAAHTGPVTGLAFDPSGRRVASAGADRTVRVTDLATRSAVTLSGHTSGANGVAVAPDGKRIASAGADGTVRVWDLDSNTEVLTLRGHEAAVLAVAFSPDGWQLASAGADARVKVWDAGERQDRLPLRCRAGSALGVALSPDGTRVAAAHDGQGGAITLWDTATGLELTTLRGHHGTVNGVAFAPDRDVLASVGADGTVRFWDPIAWRQLWVAKAHDGPAVGVAFSPDGRRFATAGVDRRVVVWETRTRQSVLEFSGHTGPVYSVAFSPGGRLLAAIGPDQPLRVWDIDTGRAAVAVRDPAEVGECIRFGHDGRWVVGGAGPTVWDARTGAQSGVLGDGGAAFSVAFSPDGKRVVTGGSGKAVRVWDTATWLEVLTLSGHPGSVRAVAFDAAGDRLVSAGDLSSILVWDATPLTAEHRDEREGYSLGRYLSRDGRSRAGVIAGGRPAPVVTERVRAHARRYLEMVHD